ncbi:hypothetical protein H9Q13_03115 [Pontibacter sp. JH31]|uniref:Uncharacterized protein n=1 Tax=Pontibacter aquaedesilientis TaxID=2766980 RepID=A0ABR7XCW9_9BACT|nr:hypothetical protein [Pontibacter aquaedesilientis]MBD1396143.1 hypothetical protein [Pontibacter aquaedesilientis]
MRPEDIDKLFKERLGPSAPTPPADLWNRLQDRMETEMPGTNLEERKPKSFMWLSYSVAAAIALVLSVGIVFYNVQRGTVAVDGMARNNGQVAEQPLQITEPIPNAGIAKATESVTAESPIEQHTSNPVASVPKKSSAIPEANIAKVTPQAAGNISRSKSGASSSTAPTQRVAQVEKAAILVTPEKGDYYNTGETVPASFASNTVDMNAQPVEIIIKRAVAVQQVEDYDELSGFEKKQKLAKNLFKQVRNLSNGERVELSELGINADKIALETQIGKQKISKVINL